MKFSIIIPAYKKIFLSEAIESVLNQTHLDFELIIVDDCSPEDLKTIVEQFDDKRIKYYRNKKNCGAINVVDNWNTGLSFCKEEYVICIGDDDLLLPNCLEEYAKLMAKYPKLGVYHAWTEIIDEKKVLYQLQQPRPEFESALSLAWNRWNGRTHQYIGDFCYNINQLRADGGFYKLPLAWASDDISAVRAARNTGIANMQVLGFQYRENRFSITQGGQEDLKIQSALQEKEWYLSFFQEMELKELSNLDEKYLGLLKKDLLPHIHKEIRLEIISSMRNNHFKFLKHIKRHNLYGISILRIISYLFESFK